MLHLVLEQRVRLAVAAVLPDANTDHLTVRPCPDPKFGDYQTAALMSLARERKLNPRQLASDVVARLQVGDVCEPPEIAGAGFINFRLKPAALLSVLEGAAQGGPLFFRPAERPRTIVIDFSSPNVAKPMHVGHIRSTILGDCLTRTLRLLGHRVITDNHVGDWGTQFGMLLHHVRSSHPHAGTDSVQFRIQDLEAFYKEAKRRFDEDPAFAEASRAAVVALQSGDREAVRLWEIFCRESLRHCEEIYARLGVKFDHTLGESFYNARLKPVVEELRARGLARESEGALAVFFDDIPQLKDHPAIVQKSDGGFNYMTTDLATLSYRLETWQPDEIVYVTDGRQQAHFQQLFAIFRRWQPERQVRLAHVWFGMVLGEDGRPFKTRSGENIKLSALLDEAEERAFRIVTEKNPDLPEAARREVARVVGIGAVKYADLLPNRQSDYVFSWDKMLALNGNTAPYILYAYARIRSIFRKLEPPALAAGPAGPFTLSRPEEFTLGKHLLHFGLVLEAVAEEYRPNYLCNYLYELAGHFARFFETCPVLKAEGAERTSRLALCDLTARVLRQGLEALGIQTLEQM
ncbi:MAG TPA: arginine--tRNA ligase [Methylomirabilota bacterium]|nr:arginine--tRNA ligase [Methylomirabilota bacterium]